MVTRLVSRLVSHCYRQHCVGASLTHPRPQTWALTQMNLSHKTAPANLDRKRFFGLTRQIFIRVEGL